VALTLFVGNLFHMTATSKRAFDAGVANGTLFQHFKTKTDNYYKAITTEKESH